MRTKQFHSTVSTENRKSGDALFLGAADARWCNSDVHTNAPSSFHGIQQSPELVASNATQNRSIKEVMMTTD